MGIYDRDYYRRDGPGFLGSLTERGMMVKWLIGINIICFILQMLTRTTVQTPLGPEIEETFTNALILDARAVLQGEVWRLLTCAFLHSTESIWHIVFNMFVLWIFGRQVEDERGPREFLAFYLTAAVVSSLAFMVCDLIGLQPGRALGASGAVMGVMVLSACYNPRQIIYLFFVIPVPIWGAIVLMVFLDAFSLLGTKDNPVAVAAHLGGAAFGYVYWKMQWNFTRTWSGLFARKGRRASPNLKIYREESEESSTPTPVVAQAALPAREAHNPSGPDEHLEAQVDAILEKISRVGKDNLTENERQVLLRASELLRRRRT